MAPLMLHALLVPLSVSQVTPTPSIAPSPITQVVMLGTGTPIPEPDHQGPAATRKGVKGLTMDRLTRAFITHLHSDHTVGYPDLLFTPSVINRVEPLEVFGPKGLKRMTDHIEQAWSEDRDIRTHGGEGAKASEYVVHVHEVEEGPIYEDKNVKVNAIAVLHGKWKHAFGYRFETPDRVIVVSGDTTYCPNLIKNAQGCDILIHEVYSEAGLKVREERWRNYHSRYHTSAPDLGRIANEVKPKLLVLYHELPFGQTREEILDEVRSVYSGPVVQGEDLAVY